MLWSVCLIEEKISGRMLKKYTALSLRRGYKIDGKGKEGVSLPLVLLVLLELLYFIFIV